MFTGKYKLYAKFRTVQELESKTKIFAQIIWYSWFLNHCIGKGKKWVWVCIDSSLWCYHFGLITLFMICMLIRVLNTNKFRHEFH